MEKYLEEGSLSLEDLQTGLRKGTVTGELCPVLVCSSLENKGGVAVLEAIQALLPAATERPAFVDAQGQERAPRSRRSRGRLRLQDPGRPLLRPAFLVRILSGTISGDVTLKNMRSGENERLGSLLFLTGKTQTPCKEPVGPGAIVAVAKLKNTRTGDSLCDEKAALCPAHAQAAAAAHHLRAGPQGKRAMKTRSTPPSSACWTKTSPLRLARDEENGDILLSGMGQLHIELSVEKAKRRFKVDINLKTPKVPYRETVRGKVQVQGRHKKQSGGRGQFGDCWIEMEGLPRGSGYVFEDAIVGGVIPRQYIPAIDKGIQEAAARGFLAGCQVVDFRVKVYDGSYHTVDSSEMAFKVAGSLAFKKAMESLKPVLLEPIVLLTVSVPDECMGDVIGDLSSRRGKVLGSDSAAGVTEIKAHVPMSEVLRYAPDLRSMTAGQGFFTMEFAHYEEAPQPVADKVIAEHQKAVAGE